MRTFTSDYLDVFGSEIGQMVGEMMSAFTPGRVRQGLDEIEALGCDELILVPATTDVRCLDLVADVVASR